MTCRSGDQNGTLGGGRLVQDLTLLASGWPVGMLLKKEPCEPSREIVGASGGSVRSWEEANRK